MREIRRVVGLGSDDLIEHLLGKDRDPDDEQFVAAHHALYSTYFDRLPTLDAAGDRCAHWPGEAGRSSWRRRRAARNSPR